MHLTQHTDYALRVLLYLAAHPDQPVDAPLIASSFGISLHHVRKVVYELGRREYIVTSRGRAGGIRLLKAPSEISIGRVVRDMEPSLSLVECFEASTNTCPIIGVCGLERLLRKANAVFLAELDRHTLAQVMREPSALSAALARHHAQQLTPLDAESASQGAAPGTA